mmetsp:Transcript_66696/g.159456  ORF Transcript_66696/g.159456 Transcript_66696/m.159456 type:complete len:901 (-) Transcript_66696:59-2761(-)
MRPSFAYNEDAVTQSHSSFVQQSATLRERGVSDSSGTFSSFVAHHLSALQEKLTGEHERRLREAHRTSRRSGRRGPNGVGSARLDYIYSHSHTLEEGNGTPVLSPNGVAHGFTLPLDPAWTVADEGDGAPPEIRVADIKVTFSGAAASTRSPVAKRVSDVAVHVSSNGRATPKMLSSTTQFGNHVNSMNSMASYEVQSRHHINSLNSMGTPDMQSRSMEVLETPTQLTHHTTSDGKLTSLGMSPRVLSCSCGFQFSDNTQEICLKCGQLRRDFGCLMDHEHCQCEGPDQVTESAACRLCGLPVSPGDEASFWKLRQAWEQGASSTPAVDHPILEHQRAPRVRRHTAARRTSRASAASRSGTGDLELVLGRFGCHWSNFIIEPYRKRRFMWDLLAAAFILYDLATLPLQWAFEDEATYGNPTDTLLLWIIMTFWTVDIPWGFFTGYYKQGRVVMDPYQVAMHHLKTGFLVDIAAVAPDWYLVLVASGSTGEGGSFTRVGKTVRGIRIMRTTKFLRLARLHRVLQELMQAVTNEYVGCLLEIVKLSVCMLVVNHYLACGWYYFGSVGNDDGPGWVNAHGLQHDGAGRQYMFSLHWSLTNFCGNTGIYPRNLDELIFATIAVYSAMLCFSFFVSSVTNAMVQLQKYTSSSTERSFWLHRYLREQKVSKRLQVRVRKFLREDSNQPRNDINLTELMSVLPANLVAEINSDVVTPVLKRSDLLRICCDNFPHVLPKICTESICQQTFLDEENIFTTGEEGRHIPFLLSGVARYDTEYVDTVQDIDEQRWYCEVALYLKWFHLGTLYGHLQCVVILLDVEAFEKLAVQNKKLLREVAEKAKEFKQWLQDEVKPYKATDLLTFTKDRGDGPLHREGEQALQPIPRGLCLIRIQNRERDPRVSVGDNL